MVAIYDYLVIGHVTRDLIEGGWIIGGTASYSGRIGQALGARTAIVTSFDASFPAAALLPDIAVVQIPANQTTTFSNIYTATGRTQIVHRLAAPISVSDVPDAFSEVPVVHLAPLVDEVDPALASHFPNSLVGITPQGWMRRWNGEGHVYATHWPQAEAVLRQADAVILSEEDLPESSILVDFRRWARLLVVTEAEKGCTVFWRGESRQFPASPVDAVGLTGAGDVFATAFLLQLHLTGGDAWAAAQFANIIAGQTVAVSTLDEKARLVATRVTHPGYLKDFAGN